MEPVLSRRYVTGSPRWVQFLETIGAVLEIDLEEVPAEELSRFFDGGLASEHSLVVAGDGSSFAFRVFSDCWVLGRTRPGCLRSADRTSEVARLAQKAALEFHAALSESLRESRKSVEISALKQMNRIVLSLFQSADRGSRSSVEKAVDLILSTLVIMLDAPGSWFSYSKDGERHLVTKGDGLLVHRFLETGEGRAVQLPVTAKGYEAVLGVLDVDNTGEVSSLLSLLSEECVIVLEVNQLFELVQAHLREFLAGIDSAAILVDSRGYYTYMNPGAVGLFGCPASEILGSPVADVPAPWRHAVARPTGDTVKGSMERLCPRGSPKWINWTATPVWDSGALYGWVVFAEDRTDYYRLQEAAREAERLAATASTVGMLAHELRNPLAAAKGLLQLVERKRDPDRAAGYVGLVQRELDRATRLLNEFLLLGKPAPVSMELLDLGVFVEDLRPLLEGEALLGSVDLRIEVEQVPPVLLDPSQFTQVVLNLVRNAVESAGENGRVVVRARRFENKVAMECMDNGHGLSDEVLSKAFTPFFTTKERGTGLGLAVARAIVHSHGGLVTAENMSGGGALFRVTLPLPVKEGETPVVDALVASADPVLLMACEHALRVSGLTVESAAGAGEAFRGADKIRPAVLVVIGNPDEIVSRSADSLWPGATVIFVGESVDYRDLVFQVHAALGNKARKADANG